MWKIDSDVDAIILESVGQRAKEYEYREAESRALKASGYTADAGPYLLSLINANGIGKQVAADIVIEQADAWLGALIAMSNQRLAAKVGVRSGSVESTMAAWSGFVAQLRSALGLRAIT